MNRGNRRFGGEDFLDRLADQMDEEPAENHEPRQAGEAMRLRASKLVMGTGRATGSRDSNLRNPSRAA